MSSVLSSGEISNDAAWLAQALDVRRQVVRLVAMNRDDYRSASFLDDRLLKRPMDQRIVRWRDIEEVMRGNHRADARWIFHIGHVGSTLVSRLLGEIDGVLALREPQTLHAVARLPSEARPRYAETVTKLMSRTFARGETACVKATSFVSEVAPELVPPGERALFLFVEPQNYIATILRSQNSLAELRAKAPSRAQRLSARVAGFDSPPSNDAQLAAIAWACEMTSLEAAAERMGGRKLAWCNFDAMLSDLPLALGDLARHFGFAARAEAIRSIATGPLTTRYSKIPAYPYSVEQRRETIDRVADLHASDLEEALAMLSRASERSPLLAGALHRAAKG